MNRSDKVSGYEKEASDMADVRLDFYDLDADALPDVCMRCGAAAVARPVKQFSWMPYWARFVPPIIGVWFVKRRRVPVPLCERHKGHWTIRYLVGIGGILRVGRDLGLRRRRPSRLQRGQRPRRAAHPARRCVFGDRRPPVYRLADRHDRVGRHPNRRRRDHRRHDPAQERPRRLHPRLPRANAARHRARGRGGHPRPVGPAGRPTWTPERRDDTRPTTSTGAGDAEPRP